MSEPTMRTPRGDRLYCVAGTDTTAVCRRTGEDRRRRGERRTLRFYNNAGNRRIKMLPRRQADRRKG